MRLMAMLLLLASCAQAQDADWLRTFEETQRRRPRAT
jgi:hypothetical protein